MLKFLSRVLRLRVPVLNLKEELRTLALSTFGSALYCAAAVFFLKPAMLPNTGVTGICLLLNYVFNVPLGLSNMLFNALLFIFAWKFLPRRFFYWSLYCVVIISVFMEVFELFPKPVIGDKMLLVVVSGVMQGLASAINFSCGASTGGIDIPSVAVRRKYGIELGNITMYVNFGVILLSLTIVPFENALYGFLQAFISSLVLNGDLRTFSQRKEAMIITNNPELVRNYIVHSLHRGVTIFDAHGGWKDDSRKVLISLLAPRQDLRLKNFLYRNDPGAFMRLASCSEVHGKGFAGWEE